MSRLYRLGRKVVVRYLGMKTSVDGRNACGPVFFVS